MKQTSLLPKSARAYGGTLRNTRAGRRSARPLVTRSTMHLVLRSTQAFGEHSFRRPGNARAIDAIIAKFSVKYGVKIVSFANVGNHLHFHIKLGNRFTYVKFICAVTAAIAVTVGKCSRWNKNRKRFWDLRPFTRALSSYREYRILQDYVRLNGWEGSGRDRLAGAILLKRKREIETYFLNIRNLMAGTLTPIRI